MHPRRTTIAGQFLYLGAVAFSLGYPGGKLADDVTQTMCLLLTGYVARDAARILYVLLPIEHFSHCGRLGTRRIPHMDCEDQRALARIVVEHRLGRRVRQNASVPI